LDELTNADAILNVVDASGGTNAEGEPVEVGSYDPVDDVEFIEEEMDLWIAGIIDRNWETVERQSRSPEFDFEEALTEMLTGVGASEYDVMAVLRAMEYSADPFAWGDGDRKELARRIRERTKPIVVVANKADIAPEGNVERLKQAAERVVPCTAEGELALRQAVEAGVVDYDPGDEDFESTGGLSDAQAEGLERIRGVMREFGGTGLQNALDEAVYDLLDRITVYPVQNDTKWTDGQGNVLPDAFLLASGSTPKDLAFAVHSDIGEGYLHAVDARESRRIGEDHELDEGDVIKIVSTAN
ncbi:MAG: YchF-related putative GTPase, partial [Natronomonas sp.]